MAKRDKSIPPSSDTPIVAASRKNLDNMFTNSSRAGQKPTCIALTAVCCKSADGKPAGFHLLYDGSGYLAGVCTICRKARLAIPVADTQPEGTS